MQRSMIQASLASLALVAALLVGVARCENQGAEGGNQPGGTSSSQSKGSDMRATIKTNQGDIQCELFPDKAPETVENFVGLARGTKQWTDQRTGETTSRPLYSGTIFHRIIPDFMIQGGDPMGNGRGGPGYRFKDEFVPGLNFDKPYILAMANAGPNTNGSQFFITVKATPWLNQKHTIFGDCSASGELIEKLSKVQTGPGDRPVQDVVIEEIVVQD